MSRASLLARARAAAQASMTDTCTIRREQSGGTTDDLTGQVAPNLTVVYTGPCRLQQQGLSGRREESGEASVVVMHPELQLPIATSTAVRRGDIATIDTCVNDPGAVGRKFRIRDEVAKSEATARRMTCEEST